MKGMLLQNLLHMSIDDVNASLRRITSNCYNSLYEDKFFCFLRLMHSLFGLKVTLYVYAQNGKWSLADVPERYKQEFEEASSWLKFGFHAVSNKQKEGNVLSNFEDTFVETESQIRRFAGEKSIAKIVRLHYWFYPKAYQGVLKNYDVHTILTKEGQQIESMGLNQWETNIRIEQDTMKEIIYKISHCKQNQPLVGFTHEWAFNRRNKVKFAIIIASLRLKGYKFICD